jgi:hypothetical protein
VKLLYEYNEDAEEKSDGSDGGAMERGGAGCCGGYRCTGFWVCGQREGAQEGEVSLKGDYGDESCCAARCAKLWYYFRCKCWGLKTATALCAWLCCFISCALIAGTITFFLLPRDFDMTFQSSVVAWTPAYGLVSSFAVKNNGLFDVALSGITVSCVAQVHFNSTAIATEYTAIGSLLDGRLVPH